MLVLWDNREVELMQVAELVLRDVTLVAAGDSVQSAARAIADIDSRFILIQDDDRVVGVLTRGDIVIRVGAAGLDPIATPVSQVMSSSLFTCTEQESAESAARRMFEHRIEQMPVLDTAGRLVGVITRHAADTLSTTGSGQ
jgi:CBS domain-containing protein